MNILRIRQYPDPVLRRKCLSVAGATDKERKLFEQMLFIMRRFKGIGLAAPQVGISQSLIVADIGKGAIRLANPTLLKIQGSDEAEECCLSIPGARILVNRPAEVIVGGLNEKGKSVIIEAEGLLAKVLQHEMDHLEGRLIIDYLNFSKHSIGSTPK
ncbi:MAG: peptide deformylase [Candidatus Omnitrophota bacterium]